VRLTDPRSELYTVFRRVWGREAPRLKVEPLFEALGLDPPRDLPYVEVEDDRARLLSHGDRDPDALDPGEIPWTRSTPR
jgi:hypothetical protein